MKKIRILASKLKKKLLNLKQGGNDGNIISFKKNIWQTDQVSEAFVKGSDASLTSFADVMDREVNVFFLKCCQRNDKVLDIGCGHGIVSEFLASHGIEVTAVDISEKLLDNLRQRVQGKNLPLTIVLGDAYNIPCETNFFDKVVARMFLPHFPDWPKVLKEMARVTRPGGRILVHFPSREHSILAKRLGSQNCNFETRANTNNPWFYYAETDRRELDKISKSLGLTVISRTPVGFFSHNRIIGNQIGQKFYDQYQKELSEKLADEKIKEFVVWFDNIFTANAEPDFSISSIITFEKKLHA